MVGVGAAGLDDGGADAVEESVQGVDSNADGKVEVG